MSGELPDTLNTDVRYRSRLPTIIYWTHLCMRSLRHTTDLHAQ